MTLPRVHVKLTADGRGEVWVNDQQLPGVLAVNVLGAAGEVPRVVATIRPDEVTIDLPEAGMQLLRSGPSATEFAARINPRRLERDALARLDDVATQGEAFAAAVSVQAAEFDRG